MAFRRSLVATTWILSLLYHSCDGQKSQELKSLFDKDERDLLLFRGPKLLSYYEELSSYSSLEAKDIGTYHNLIAEELHSTLSESENFPNNEEEYLSMALEQITQSLCTDFISGKLTGGSGKGEREIGVEEIALIQECAGEVDTMFEKALDEVADDASTVSKMTEDKMPYTSSRLFNVTEYFVSTTQMFDNIVPDFEMIGYFNKIMDLTLSLNYENAEPTIDEFNAIIDQVEADIAGDEMTAREELRIVAVQAVASVAASSTELWSTHFQDSDSGELSHFMKPFHEYFKYLAVSLFNLFSHVCQFYRFCTKIAYTKFMTKEGRMDTNYICLLNIFIWAVFRKYLNHSCSFVYA